ncbi:MAG: iron-containing alcohol dehydrogenase [Solibacillus sp.]
MRPFLFHNPVKLYFGQGSLRALNKMLQPQQKVLVVYGGGSIKRNGVYDEVMGKLRELQVEVFELSGVEPNPRVETARQGITICKKENIALILAVGGGSVIDCVKLIAAGALIEEDAWAIPTQKVKVKDALPFGVIVTLASTGSEMNNNSVITNSETNEKLDWASGYVFPQFAIADPRYTVTVPKDHTVYGMVDIMSHCIEQYFHNETNTAIIDAFATGILRTMIEVAPKLVAEPENVVYRETVLHASTMALNGLLTMGVYGDWGSHMVEHAVSAIYDIPHAGGLAILQPHWMRHFVDVNPARFAKFAVDVFAVEQEAKTLEEIAYEGIDRLSAFWQSLGAPSRLADYGIDASRFDDIISHVMAEDTPSAFVDLQASDVRAILEKSL